MKYYVTKGNITNIVLSEQHNIMDFIDYGVNIHVTKQIVASGWIETMYPISTVEKNFELIEVNS